MTEEQKHIKEYYFFLYFKQAEAVKNTRELIIQLNNTKKEIIESETYIKAIQYSDMPKGGSFDNDKMINAIIRRDEKIENIDKRIEKALQKQERDAEIFDKIEDMLKTMTSMQRQVFELVYKEKMRHVEVAYTLGVTDRNIQYIKKEIFEKAEFIIQD
jgi:DNA-directed RNA polymerase specialized sigma subunit